MIVLPIAYFPPIPWYSLIYEEESFLIEIYQHYRKQKYTNRMYIRSANNPLCLSIPVRRRGQKMPIKEKQISYQENWQKRHWQSLVSAYRNSPYFQYYEDELGLIYQKQPKFLIDFLSSCLGFMHKKLKLENDYQFSQSYLPTEFYVGNDCRELFDSGFQAPIPGYKEIRYPQVFEGFVGSLSCLDLLFNEGPEAKLIIKQSNFSLQSRA